MKSDAEIQLFGFWASSATWRVRAALMFKELKFNEIPIDIVGKDETFMNYKRDVNQLGFVPAIKISTLSDKTFCESLPIIELLETMFPETKSLIPNDPILAHRVRQICEVVNAGMQPVQNLSVLQALDLTKDKKSEYLKMTQCRGLETIEQLVDSNGFCVGNSITMADLFLVPQMRNVAERFQIDISPYPKCKSIFEKMAKEEVFVKSHPKNQPDAGADPVSN